MTTNNKLRGIIKIYQYCKESKDAYKELREGSLAYRCDHHDRGGQGRRGAGCMQRNRRTLLCRCRLLSGICLPRTDSLALYHLLFVRRERGLLQRLYPVLPRLLMQQHIWWFMLHLDPCDALAFIYTCFCLFHFLNVCLIKYCNT